FVMDCSFISTTKLLPAVFPLIREDFGIVLIKPQFEGKRSDIKKGGEVRNNEVLTRILNDYRENLNNSGYYIEAVTEVPHLKGMKNREFISVIKLSN
ncbi:MAG: TlyA family rRNA (cytidine-2'-O)-methyltransferase, partial [candidate division WOR-3 bacterium]|nr:TlyA family rRNA (cytidine-2'-O)-methyltransferase [candidate division WOR-3 bacterium]